MYDDNCQGSLHFDRIFCWLRQQIPFQWANPRRITNQASIIQRKDQLDANLSRESYEARRFPFKNVLTEWKPEPKEVEFISWPLQDLTSNECR